MDNPLRRIIIICEGQTEQEFCKNILNEHFLNKSIYIQAPIVKKTAGGIVGWNALKKQIENHLLQEKEIFVSTFIDYYGICQKHQYPQWQEIHKTAGKSKSQIIDSLEQAMKDDIESQLQSRFIPYIQLHEFESLLFNNIQAFEKCFSKEEFSNKQELIEVLRNYQNPEEINTENPPSCRLKRVIKGYKKVLMGNFLALEIGLNNIRNKCPRFNNWINKLERI